MKKLLLIFLFGSKIIFAQEVCEKTEDKYSLNLNTINKCNIDDKSNKNNTTNLESREISVKISSNTKRYLKRREILKNLHNENLKSVKKTI